MSQTTQSNFSIKPLPAVSKWDEIEEKLDDALDKSFPASDPVSLGHTHHIGQPISFPNKCPQLISERKCEIPRGPGYK